MAGRKRTLTETDRRAAAKVRALWEDYKKRNPGVSQELAASRADMGQSAFSQFLRGTVPMRVTPVVKLARLFGVDPREIRADIDGVYTGASGSSTRAAVREPEARYEVSEDALEIARAFDQLQPQSKEFIRRQVFIYAVIDKSLPWLRQGRPVSKSYEGFERWHLENITAQRDLHAQQVGLVPKRREKAKR